jgi:replication initiator protein
MEPDLFFVSGTVHDLIERRGRQGAREVARIIAREPGRNAPIDILTGRRGVRIIEAAANHMSDETSLEKAVRSHVYSGWCHAGMPHKRPRIEDANWRIETDYVTLLVEPGTRVQADGREARVGLPFGSYARLILIDWQTEALERGSREVVMGPSLKTSLKRMGLSHDGKVMELVREQIERLATCRFTFHLKTNGQQRRGAIANVNIVDAIEYCEVGQGTTARRYVERVRLSEVFYQQLQAHPVSVDKSSVMAIRDSSMALDLYMWLAYRLRALEGEREISSALKGQFGGGVSAM